MSLDIPYSKSLVLNDLLAHATFSDRFIVQMSEKFKGKNDDYLLSVINVFSQNTMLNNFEQRILTESKQKLMERIEASIES